VNKNCIYLLIYTNYGNIIFIQEKEFNLIQKIPPESEGNKL